MRPLFAPMALFVYSASGIAAAPSLYDQLQWRMIGPFRGGRVAAVAGVMGDATTFYTSSVGGGVWKTTNAGVSWFPIFDSQPIASIGAIAVAPSDPNVIYVGTGEADIRSQIGFGDGVYKSTDAGKTWRNVGLKDTRQIAMIRVDPRNPDLVYVAALGHAYGPNAERGVFRSRDGGGNWQKVLDKGPDIGAVDLAFEPADARSDLRHHLERAASRCGANTRRMKAAGGGLYKSTDGGDHWSEIAGHGLPEGGGAAPASRWRRSGRRVYVLVDAKSAGGLYRSDDSGANWTRVSGDSRIYSRYWYFSSMTVDPKNPDLVYLPNMAIYRSMDGGKTFTVFKGAPGGDDYPFSGWIPLRRGA